MAYDCSGESELPESLPPGPVSSSRSGVLAVTTLFVVTIGFLEEPKLLSFSLFDDEMMRILLNGYGSTPSC